MCNLVSTICDWIGENKGIKSVREERGGRERKKKTFNCICCCSFTVICVCSSGRSSSVFIRTRKSVLQRTYMEIQVLDYAYDMMSR